jgi:hypothetical protein
VRGRHTAEGLGHSKTSDLVRQFFSREVLFESSTAPRQAPPFDETCSG